MVLLAGAVVGKGSAGVWITRSGIRPRSISVLGQRSADGEGWVEAIGWLPCGMVRRGRRNLGVYIR